MGLSSVNLKFPGQGVFANAPAVLLRCSDARFLHGISACKTRRPQLQNRRRPRRPRGGTSIRQASECPAGACPFLWRAIHSGAWARGLHADWPARVWRALLLVCAHSAHPSGSCLCCAVPDEQPAPGAGASTPRWWRGFAAPFNPATCGSAADRETATTERREPRGTGAHQCTRSPPRAHSG